MPLPEELAGPWLHANLSTAMCSGEADCRANYFALFPDADRMVPPAVDCLENMAEADSFTDSDLKQYISANPSALMCQCDSFLGAGGDSCSSLSVLGIAHVVIATLVALYSLFGVYQGVAIVQRMRKVAATKMPPAMFGRVRQKLSLVIVSTLADLGLVLWVVGVRLEAITPSGKIFGSIGVMFGAFCTLSGSASMVVMLMKSIHSTILSNDPNDLRHYRDRTLAAILPVIQTATYLRYFGLVATVSGISMYMAPYPINTFGIAGVFVIFQSVVIILSQRTLRTLHGVFQEIRFSAEQDQQADAVVVVIIKHQVRMVSKVQKLLIRLSVRMGLLVVSCVGYMLSGVFVWSHAAWFTSYLWLLSIAVAGSRLNGVVRHSVSTSKSNRDRKVGGQTSTTVVSEGV